MTVERERATLRVPSLALTEDITRREFLVGSAGLLLLAPYGCDDGRDGGAAASAETRTVGHALGETEVPRRVARVADISSGVLDLAAIGAPVLGATSWNTAGGFPEHARGELEGVEFVGLAHEPNLEKIAALEPDLILGEVTRGHERVYERLSEIAPTVVHEYTTPNWADFFWERARLVGREEEARELEDGYRRRTEAFRLKHRDLLQDATATMAVFYGDGASVYHESTYSGRILADCGFRRPGREPRAPAEGAAPLDEASREISQEKIPEFLDTDVLFVAVMGDGSNAQSFREFSGSPLWERLPAVRKGRVYRVDMELWLGGTGYAEALLILDELEGSFSGEGS